VRTKELIKKIAPIHKHELAKFFCMSSMILLILFIIHSIRLTRETLVISHLGTEAISAIELLVLPISIVFTIFYIKLSTILTRTRLFHTMIWFFVSYFVLFATILYPNHDALALAISPNFVAKFPALKCFFKIIKNWHYSLFFVFSQLSITTLINISFWQTANHITSIEESRRLYPLFSFSSFFGLIFACYVARLIVADSSDWNVTLNKVIISVVIASLLLSVCLIILGKIIGLENLNSRRNLDYPDESKEKPKLSFKASLKHLITSKPLLLITSLILCYSIPFNLTEGLWKKTIEIYFSGNANQIHYFISKVNFYEGGICMAMALFGSYLLRNCKWKTAALVPPIVVSLTGGALFLSFLFGKHFGSLMTNISLLKFTVFIGASHFIFAKSMKNTIFDATKEMAFIPLSPTLKTQGKAACETIGIRFGKSGGAFIQQMLIMSFANLTLLDFAPVFFVIFIISTVLWVLSIISLDRSIHEKVSLNNF
jgi:ATP:ADP antiporter, AAA family